MKKILSLLLCAVVILSVWACAFSAFGKAIELDLDIKITSVIDGADDLAWFTYTPSKSGVYSFLSYNIPASEAYLFTREKQSDGSKLYVQHDYATNDPNYTENEHNSRQFCLTHYLEEGVKYYFAAGWYASDTRTSGNITVMLRCDRYDEGNEIDHIEATTTAYLTAYSDGSFMSDKNGNAYFHYNYSKIMTNMTVTVYYLDGRVSSVTGESKIDGYPIVYKETQSVNHWYANDTSQYTANTLSVSVLTSTCDVDVEIRSGGIYAVSGVINNLSGEGVSGASVIINGVTVSKTDENGRYYFTSTPGVKTALVTADNSISREVTISVSSNTNDLSEKPIELCTCDYVPDGIINAKDFAVINKTLSGEERDRQKAQYSKAINFTKSDYTNLSI